jgi:CheY-like chemotaxis protein
VSRSQPGRGGCEHECQAMTIYLYSRPHPPQPLPRRGITYHTMNKKILIIEDEYSLREMYKLKLEKEGYTVFASPEGISGIAVAKAEKPDVVLLDVMMPGMDGFEVLKILRADPETKSLKIFVFSNLGQEDEIERGLQEGADKYLIKANLTPGQLLEKIEEALAEERKQNKTDKKIKTVVKKEKQKILLIEDENDIIAMYDLSLRQAGFEIDIARNGAWGLKLARANKYDLITMDVVMPAMNGVELLRKLREESLHSNIPIIVLSNSAQDQDIAEAKKNGATAYLLKAKITPANLVKEIKKYLK